MYLPAAYARHHGTEPSARAHRVYRAAYEKRYLNAHRSHMQALSHQQISYLDRGMGYALLTAEAAEANSFGVSAEIIASSQDTFVFILWSRSLHPVLFISVHGRIVSTPEAF